MTTNTTNLRANQIQFCKWIWDAGASNPDGNGNYHYSRAFLRYIAIKNGMQWAPAWIVKDKSRNVGRGLYNVPEMAAYIASIAANPTQCADGAD